MNQRSHGLGAFASLVAVVAAVVGQQRLDAAVEFGGNAGVELRAERGNGAAQVRPELDQAQRGGAAAGHKAVDVGQQLQERSGGLAQRGAVGSQAAQPLAFGAAGGQVGGQPHDLLEQSGPTKTIGDKAADQSSDEAASERDKYWLHVGYSCLISGAVGVFLTLLWRILECLQQIQIVMTEDLKSRCRDAQRKPIPYQ